MQSDVPSPRILLEDVIGYVVAHAVAMLVIAIPLNHLAYFVAFDRAGTLQLVANTVNMATVFEILGIGVVMSRNGPPDGRLRPLRDLSGLRPGMRCYVTDVHHDGACYVTVFEERELFTGFLVPVVIRGDRLNPDDVRVAVASLVRLVGLDIKSIDPPPDRTGFAFEIVAPWPHDS